MNQPTKEPAIYTKEWTPESAGTAIVQNLERLTKKPQILVVDNDHVFLDFMRGLIESVGYTPVALDNGADAMEWLRLGNCSLAFVDIFMPGLDGMQLVRRAKSENIRTKLVIMTGHPFQDAMLMALDAGAWMFLKKPFTVGNVLEILGSVKL